jgi:hypothetical protein
MRVPINVITSRPYSVRRWRSGRRLIEKIKSYRIRCTNHSEYDRKILTPQ